MGASVVGSGVDRAVARTARVVRASPREWERTYVRVLVGLDGLAALCAGTTAYLVRFGDSVGGSRRWDYIAL